MAIKGIVIFFYTLNGISLVCTSVMVIISFVYYLHRKFITQLMIIVFLSEIMNSLSIYLSFLRNSCFDDYTNNELYLFCTKMSFEGLIQTFFGIYSEIWTLTTCCCITFKIYDLLNNNSSFLSKESNQNICKLIIFVYPPIMALSLVMIQGLNYKMKDSGKGNEKIGRCLIMDCFLAHTLTYALIAIITISLIFILVITSLISRFLKTYSSTLPSSNEKEKKVIMKMGDVRCKSLCFPIMTWIIWVLYYVDRVARICFQDNKESKEIIYYLGIFYGFINGLRGILFSILFYYTQTNFRRVFHNIFNKKRTTKLFDTNEYQLTSGSSLNFTKL